MNKKRIVGILGSGIGFWVLLDFLKSTSLYFTDAEAINFIAYLRAKNEFLGSSNGFVLFIISAAIICTYLNKLKDNKKVG